MIDLSSVDVENLLVRLDLKGRMTASGREVNFSCFGAEHTHGDETPSAYINVETTAWMCHGCKRRGNAVSLVMESQSVSRSTAEGELRAWYGIEFNEPVGGSMVAETESRFRPVLVKPDPIRPPRSWLSAVRLDWQSDALEPYQGYMFDRGFTRETLEEWDIGYDFISDRITIPVFDIDGELVGIKGRDWTGHREPKYLVLGDRPDQVVYGFEPYEASQVVFGLHRNREHRTAVLCEGELNAQALSQIGVPRPVAAGMSYFSDRHAQLLAREVDEVIVYYDYGEAGHTGTWGRWDDHGKFHRGVVQMLENHVRLRVVEPTAEDPAELVKLDHGEEALAAIQNACSSLDHLTIFR